MRKVVLLLGLVFVLGFVSACGDCYGWDCDALRQVPSGEGNFLSYKKVVDNPNRFPVETYGLGYTYRETNDFKDRHGILEKVVRLKFEKHKVKDWRSDRNYHREWGSGPERRNNADCYYYPPKGKLFYKKCV